MKRGAWITVWLLSMALLAAAGAQSQDDDVSYQCWEQGGVWNQDSQECHQHVNFSIDVEIPLEYAYSSDPGDFLVWSTYNQYLAELRDSFIQQWNDYPPARLGLPGWRMDVDYAEYHHDDIMTLAFHVMQSTGTRDYVPQDDHFMKTFTFDLASNTLIEWSDLFRQEADPWPTIDPIIRADLRDQLRQYDDDPLPRKIGLNNREPWFALDGDDLILFYWSFEVAKDFVALEADPILQVRIPLSRLSDILAPRFLPET